MNIRARIIRERNDLGIDNALDTRNKKEITIPIREIKQDRDTVVLDMLQKVPLTVNSFRNDGYVHVSDAINKCLRKFAILQKLEINHPDEKLFDGQAITYAIGISLHDYVRQKFVDTYPNKVYAQWVCTCGAIKTEPMLKSQAARSSQCNICGTRPHRHKEVNFVSKELNVSGSPDLILYLNDLGVYYPIEIKSMAAKSFNELVRPLPDHIVQISFYWYLMQLNKMPLANSASILYVNKEYSFKSVYKEFIVNTPSEESLLSSYIEDLVALENFKKNGKLPLRTFCSSINSPDARKCPVCNYCFDAE